MISDLLSIKVMKQIFDNECKSKINATSMIIYQYGLLRHFDNLEETINNLNEFEVDISTINNYSNFTDNFLQLKNAGLIEIKDKTICFKDVWRKYINTSRMKYLNNSGKADDFKDQMYNSHQLVELIMMKYKVSKKNVNELLQLFFAEQAATQNTYADESQCRMHFVNWVKTNKDKVSSTKATSSGKILGT